jgi:hypothetical protein
MGTRRRAIPLVRALLLLAAASAAVAGQDVPLEIKGGDAKSVTYKSAKTVVYTTETTLVTSFPFAVVAPPNPAALYFWTYPQGVVAVDKGDRLEISAAPAGELVINVKLVLTELDKAGVFKGFKTQFGSTRFTIGEVPRPPPEPEPKPKPSPPEPVTPAPIPVAGLRVLIVYETGEVALSLLTPGQYSALFSTKARAYYNSVCTPGPDGKTREWRIYDQNVKLAGESKLWQDVMQRPRSSLPWLVVSNPAKGGFEGPLPKTFAETQALIEKYKD